MEIVPLDSVLALSVTLCGIAGCVLIGLVAIFYVDESRARISSDRLVAVGRETLATRIGSTDHLTRA